MCDYFNRKCLTLLIAENSDNIFEVSFGNNERQLCCHVIKHPLHFWYTFREKFKKKHHTAHQLKRPSVELFFFLTHKHKTAAKNFRSSLQVLCNTPRIYKYLQLCSCYKTHACNNTNHKCNSDFSNQYVNSSN